jgi:hypothetical protein
MSISCCVGEMKCVLTALPLASKYHPSGSLKKKASHKFNINDKCDRQTQSHVCYWKCS